MTTAREQAREAAFKKFLATDPNLPTAKAMVEAEADAASDVWEPLVRDLLVAYEHAVAHLGSGHRGPIPWGAYTRAKEALAQP